jgi:hypothetical protein
LHNPTIKLSAIAYGISTSYVVHALRLTPEQRQAVRREERPLILPRAPSLPPAPPIPPIAPVTPPVATTVASVEERLHQIVTEIGIWAALDLLAANEKVAA